ncbi:PorT family protein [bacterium]|nr:PorT family protein [bacterium]
MKYCIYILTFLLSTPAFAQLYDPGSKIKFGVKTGLNFSSYFGNEFQNPRPRFGYTAGIYFRTKLSDNTHFHTELLGNYKGSNFKNEGANEYVKISSFHLDLPTYLVLAFKDNKHNVMFGPQFSRHLISSMYISGQSTAYADSVNFKPFSIDFGVAYQHNSKVVSTQFGVKMGITDQNGGVFFEDINPPTGKGGVIRLFSVEMALIF